MIPSCLYFLFKKRVELEFLKENFLKKNTTLGPVRFNCSPSVVGLKSKN